MNRISCDVVRDLLPLYTDGICSEASAELVEEHLKDCGECEKYKKRMGAQDIKLSLDNGKDLDYMKKIRKSMDIKAIFFFLVIVSISAAFLIYLQTGYQTAPFLLLLPVLLICNYFMFFQSNNKIDLYNRKKILCGSVINFIIVLYMPFLLLMSLNHWIQYSSYPFGLSEYNIGPFIYGQILTIMVIEIIAWITTIVIHIKTSYFHIGLSGISITGFCLALYYIQLLKSLDSAEIYLRISRVSLGILMEGLIITGLLCVIDKLRGKPK